MVKTRKSVSFKSAGSTLEHSSSSSQTETQLDDVKSLAISREDILLEENKKLQLEINRLQKQLAEVRQPKSSTRLIITDEDLITQTQLERIKFKAMEQELTLEEIKKFDLLVKNKKLSEGNPTVIADYKKLPDDVKEEDLIRLAAVPLKEDESHGET